MSQRVFVTITRDGSEKRGAHVHGGPPFRRRNGDLARQHVKVGVEAPKTEMLPRFLLSERFFLLAAVTLGFFTFN